MVVSLGRSRMLIMRNQIKSTIIPYFQIELDDNMQMSYLQKKLVVMIEDLIHHHYYYHNQHNHSLFKVQLSAYLKHHLPNWMNWREFTFDNSNCLKSLKLSFPISNWVRLGQFVIRQIPSSRLASETLKHYHSFTFHTHLSKYNSQHIQNSYYQIGWIEENSHSITQIAWNL